MKKQQGFTLIELVIVVIILGFLAAAAIPRFLDAADDAKDAAVEGVAGSFASAVGLVRAEWELRGRPDNAGTNDVVYDGINIELTDTGYPGGANGVNNAVAGNALPVAACDAIFDNILQQAPTNILTGAAYNGERYIINVSSTNPVLCTYILAASVPVKQGDNVASYLPTRSGSQGFTYNPVTGLVSVFKTP